MQRIIRIASAAVLVVLFLVFVKTAFAFVRFWKVEAQFPSIVVGDSRGSVLAKVGNPNYYSGKCGVIHFPHKDCAVEYVYSHPFAPLAPDYFIVSFSADDKVIEADRWTSS